MSRRPRHKSSFLRGRKAQEQEAQLNWIFILVVGALILAFFGFIVIKQKAASEAKFSGTVSQQLNTILIGAKVSSGTVQMIDTPELTIRFTCNDYYIGPASQRLGNKVVFAPENLEGNQLITWALDWSVPFKVSTFLYMTTPYIQYIVVDDDPDMAFYNALPSKLNKKSALFDDYRDDKIVNEGDSRVRFIFVDPDENDKNSEAHHHLEAGFDPAEISGINVYTKNSRKVEFLTVSDNGFDAQSPIEYAEDEFLYGAVFSDNADTYSCLVNRAYERLNVVSQVLRERLKNIGQSYQYSSCEGFYKNNVNLGEIITATENAGLGVIDYGALMEAKSSLVEDNTRLQMYSCPLIY